MANVRAFRSGAWSDTNPATSPWGSGGALYAPAAGDNVYSNTFTIHVDQNVTVNSVTNASATSRLWKDGATTTATTGGTFNLLDGIRVNANITAGTAVTSCVLLSGSASATLSGNTVDTAAAATGSHGITFSSNGTLTYIGDITGRTTSQAGAYSLNHTGTGKLLMTGNAVGRQNFNNSYGTAIAVTGGGDVYLTGSVTGGTFPGSSSVLARGILTNGTTLITGNILGGTASGEGVNNNGTGALTVVGNVTGLTSSLAGVAINNSSTGTAIVVGNVVATSATNAFVSANANAINKISGNIINNSNGTAAIYAARYVVDPVPTNSVIQYSNTNMFTTDSLSAFSMPPVSAVRSGVSFANSTLTGTCKVPSANSVNIGVPVDNTVGTAFLTPATLFDASVASLTASDSLGARLKNSATVQSVGNIISSFSN